MDRIDLMDHHAMVFSYNFNTPCRSEMSIIGITRTIAAGLQMTWCLSGDSKSVKDLSNQWHEYEKSLYQDSKEKATRAETMNKSADMPQLRSSQRGLSGIRKDNYPLPEDA